MDPVPPLPLHLATSGHLCLLGPASASRAPLNKLPMILYYSILYFINYVILYHVILYYVSTCIINHAGKHNTVPYRFSYSHICGNPGTPGLLGRAGSISYITSRAVQLKLQGCACSLLQSKYQPSCCTYKPSCAPARSLPTTTTADTKAVIPAAAVAVAAAAMAVAEQ